MKFDVKPFLNGAKLTLKKHSPEILVFTGIGGMIGSTVIACKATRRLDPVLEKHKQDAEAVHKKYERVKDERAEKHDLTKVYMKTGVEFVKLYGPSVAVGALSVTGILTSNNILRKRNMALAAAYAAVDAGFKQYRGRVIQRFGEDVDRELRFDGHQEKIEVVETDENGVTYDILYDILIKQNGDIHSDWTGVKLDVDKYRAVVYEPYDLRVLDGTIDF